MLRRDLLIIHYQDPHILRIDITSVITEDGCALHGQCDAAGGIRKLDRIGKDVDEHLLELHIIADIVVADTADDPALIVETLFTALGHDHGIDLFQHAAEGEFFLCGS